MGILSYTYKNVDTQENTNTDNIVLTTDTRATRNQKVNKTKTTKVLTEDVDSANYESNLSIVPKKKVSFANAVEQRTFVIEEENEVKFFDEVATQELLQDETDDVDVREISFEKTDNKFVIEDYFYRLDYVLPRRPKEIQWIKKDLPEVEYIQFCDKIENAIKIAKESLKKNTIHRIDGIILQKPTKKLILLTEFYIFDFNFTRHGEYELNRTIEICTIDFITMARSGNFLILHLVPVYKNKENINKNYLLQHQKVEKIVCCLTQSCFVDKPEGSVLKIDTINREIPVVTINDDLEIIDQLEKISNFSEYRKIFSGFLELKISECKLPGYNPEDLGFKFKYVSVRYRVKEKNNDVKDKKKINKSNTHYNLNFVSGDFIITRYALFLYQYNKNKKRLELLYHIKMNEMIKLTVNKNIKNCFIIFDRSYVPNGLEVMSESYLGLLPLIDELYQAFMAQGK